MEGTNNLNLPTVTVLCAGTYFYANITAPVLYKVQWERALFARAYFGLLCKRSFESQNRSRPHVDKFCPLLRKKFTKVWGLRPVLDAALLARLLAKVYAEKAGFLRG